MNLSNLLPRVEAHERERFFLAALAFMCVATSALIARAVGDTLFLSRLGSGRLPIMYMVGALATGLASYACARAAPRATTAQIGIFVAATLIVANLGVYLTLTILPVMSRATAYLLADLAGRIPILLYWALAAEIFDARESRRLFGLLGAVGTTACLPAGLLVGPLARRFGVAFLILVVCGLLAGFILTAGSLHRRERRKRTLAGRSLVAANAQSAGQLHRTRQFVTIAALAAITSLVQTLVDYQFKAAFTPRASGAALAAIFGQLYAYSSLAALVLQLFLVHRILRWGGVWVSLCLLPAGIMATSGVILQSLSAAWVYATKAMDITLTLTINGAARQMLYRGIRSESRLQARAFAEGLYQPMAIAAAGSILAFTVQSLTIRIMAGMAVVGALIWIAVARSAYSSYVAGLLSSLRAARFEPDDEPFGANEPAVKQYVLNALTSASDTQVKYLAAVLPNILPLSEHTNPEVRWTVVRAAAAGEFSTNENWLRAKLLDPHPRVRAFAAAGLINSGSGSAAATGRANIERLAFSEAALDRQAAAEGLAEIRRGRFTPLLERLLKAEEEEVLEAALDACLSHPDRALIPAILPLLTRRRLAVEASEALVGIGAAAVAPTARFLRVTRGSSRAEAVKKLARAVARNGDPAALPLLKRMSALVDPEDQLAVHQAIADLVRRESQADIAREIDPLIVSEAYKAMIRVEELRQLPRSPQTGLLRVALSYIVRCHIRHAFILLDVLTKDVDMMTLHTTFSGGSREGRSQVAELLYNILPENLQYPLLEVLGEAELPSVDESADPRPVVIGLLEKRAPEWVTIGALHASSELEISSQGKEIRRFLEHRNPIVRETALAALTHLEDRSVLLEQCELLSKDSDGIVSQLARSLCETG